MGGRGGDPWEHWGDGGKWGKRKGGDGGIVIWPAHRKDLKKIFRFILYFDCFSGECYNNISKKNLIVDLFQNIFFQCIVRPSLISALN